MSSIIEIKLTIQTKAPDYPSKAKNKRALKQAIRWFMSSIDKYPALFVDTDEYGAYIEDCCHGTKVKVDKAVSRKNK